MFCLKECIKHKTSSGVEAIVRNTKPFEGCALINIDELPDSGDSIVTFV
jgi:hypothetical protein